MSKLQRTLLPGKVEVGNAALALMDAHLARQDWMVGDWVTLADIALHAYTHVAEEGGGFRLADYPAVGAWLARVAALPGYIRMDS